MLGVSKPERDASKGPSWLSIMIITVWGKFSARVYEKKVASDKIGFRIEVDHIALV